KLDAQGTIADLTARLDVQMRDLRSERFSRLEPATFDLAAQVTHNQLAVSGKLQQARIQPLEVSANLPFDIPKIARARKLPDDTPITAKARLPRSSVNFLRQFVPEVQQLDGDLGLDVDVRGTIARPVLSGSADMMINVARANADIKVTGSFASANVTGDIAITNSHFLKNIDLIPIGLPGRPAPEPPSAQPEFSFPEPPLRDWKFDVAIRTKDPVVIRGNLATGGATGDLKLTGTGLHPELQGTVRLENVEATLPFSRLQVSKGLLCFGP